MYDNSSYGPTFGNAFDLHFFSGTCALGQNSGAYTINNGQSYDVSTEGANGLSGTNGSANYYNIVAFEVFAVTLVTVLIGWYNAVVCPSSLLIVLCTTELSIRTSF